MQRVLVDGVEYAPRARRVDLRGLEEPRLRGGAERGRLEGVSPKFSAEHPYTGPLLSSRTIEFAASARGASKGTSGRRKPLITLENFDAFADEDAFATTRSTVSDLFG